MVVAPIGTLKSLGAQPVRRPVAAIDIVWGGSSTESAWVQVENENRASLEKQAVRGIGYQKRWAFCDTGYTPDSSDLQPRSLAVIEPDDGIDICAMPDDLDHAYGFLVGWWGTVLSDGDGYFDGPVLPRRALVLTASTTLRLINVSGYRGGDDNAAEWPVDFFVQLYKSDGTGGLVEAVYSNGNPIFIPVYGNTSVDRQIDLLETASDITAISIIISRWSHSGAFIKITSLRMEYSETLSGDDLLSLSLLEELDGAVGNLPIGQVSSNSLSVSFENVGRRYSYGNSASPVANSTRINRRISPYIGFYDAGGAARVCNKGLYWTGDWDVDVRGTSAATTARDRLGVMQDIKYTGAVGADKPESTYWENTSIAAVAESVLTILQQREMPDLEYDVDATLTRAVPLAFFGDGTWFDVVKSIAVAGGAYAYMDTPTDAEIAAAAARGNDGLKDILRIKRHETLYGAPESEPLTLDDVISQNTTSQWDDFVNTVNVKFMRYAVVDGAAQEADGVEPGTVTFIDNASVRDYGRAEADYGESTLIQSEEHAAELAQLVVGSFAEQQRNMELDTYGDVTRRIGDVLLLPEFIGGGIDKRGDYIVSKINTEYSGGLSQSLTCRKLGDA